MSRRGQAGQLRSNLKSEENLREGLHPDQVGGHDHGGGVVGAVVVRRGFTWWDTEHSVLLNVLQAGSCWRTRLRGLTGGVFPVLVPLLVLRQAVVGLSAHRLGEVTERLGVVQVQLLV